MFNTLELFCGTKSFSKVSEKFGNKTTTIDNDPQFQADITRDILSVEFPANKYDILWASPPCEGFSVASIGHHWNKDNTPKTDKAALSLKIVERTIEIIKTVNPKYWFIENPRGKLRKLIDEIIVKELGAAYKRETICYCRYGDTRMKPTDIWTNCFEWKPVNRMCCNGNTDHESSPRGSRTGTQGIIGYKDRSRIPEELFIDIFNQIICN
jgi:hypothetical protein